MSAILNESKKQQQLQHQHTIGSSGSMAAVSGSSSRAPNASNKADEISSAGGQPTNAAAATQSSVKLKATRSIAWICCAPCVFCRTSTIFRRAALTTLTLVVTSLLVMSPILFLTQFALPARDCHRVHCIPKPHKTTPAQCDRQICVNTGNGIQARMNWRADPCNDFEGYCCSNNHSISLYTRIIRNSQETADNIMEHLITQNTTSGPYRALGRLYGSCLRLKVNASSTMRLTFHELGGFLSPGALPGITITDLLVQFGKFGITPIVNFVYEISHSRKPQINLVIEATILNTPVIEDKIRWNGMKAPIQDYLRDTYDHTIADQVISLLLPSGLNMDSVAKEKELIHGFMSELLKLKYMQSNYGNDTLVTNIAALKEEYPYFDWEKLLPTSWKRSIIVRAGDYFHGLGKFLAAYEQRVIHNSLLVLFALHLLPRGVPVPKNCAKASVWALPEAASALFVENFPDTDLDSAAVRVETIFEALKAHIKRAPTLRGKALVQLSSLKVVARPSPDLYNKTLVTQKLKQVEISSDDWFENIIKIYRARMGNINIHGINVTVDDQISWSYPMLSKPFYDPIAHAVLVPVALTTMPYFDEALPKYIHYSTVGVQIAKEIFFVTKSLEDKFKLKCAPDVIDDDSVYNRKSLLIHGAAVQIAYHALLHQSGSLERLSQLDLNPMQIMLIVAAQDFIEEELFYNYAYNSTDINEILLYLIAQGKTGTKVFSCPNDSKMNKQKTCDVW